jgi:hypothetical protein
MDWPPEQLADFVETILVYKLPKLSREEKFKPCWD